MNKINKEKLKKIISQSIREQMGVGEPFNPIVTRSTKKSDNNVVPGSKELEKIGSELKRAPAEVGGIIFEDSKKLVDITLSNLGIIVNKTENWADFCPVNFVGFSEILSIVAAQESLYQIRKRFYGDDFKKIENSIQKLEQKINDSNNLNNKKRLKEIQRELNVREGEALGIMSEIEEKLDNLSDELPDGDLKRELDLAREQVKSERAAESVMTDQELADRNAARAAKKFAGPLAAMLKRIAKIKGKKFIIGGFISGLLGYEVHMFATQTQTITGDPKEGLGELGSLFGLFGDEVSLWEAFKVKWGGNLCFAAQSSILAALGAGYIRKGSGFGLRGSNQFFLRGDSKKELKTQYNKLATQYLREGIPDLTKKMKGDLDQTLSKALQNKNLTAGLSPIREEVVRKFLDEDPEVLIRTLTSSDSPVAKRFMQTITNPLNLGPGGVTMQVKIDFLSSIFKSELNTLYKMSINNLESGLLITPKVISDPKAFPMLSQLDPKSKQEVINFISGYNDKLLTALSESAIVVFNKLYQKELSDLNAKVLDRSFKFSRKEIKNGIDNKADDLEKVLGNVATMETPEETFEAIERIKMFRRNMEANFGPTLVNPEITPQILRASGVDEATIRAAMKFKNRYQYAIEATVDRIKRSDFDPQEKEAMLIFLQDIIGWKAPGPKTAGAKVKDRKTERGAPRPPSRGAPIKRRRGVDFGSGEINEGNKIMNINKRKLKNIVKQVLNEKNKSFYPYQEPEGETDERDMSLEYKQILDDMEADPGVEVAVSLAKCLVKDQELFSVIMQMVKENPDAMERFVKLFRQQKQKAV